MAWARRPVKPKAENVVKVEEVVEKPQPEKKRRTRKSTNKTINKLGGN